MRSHPNRVLARRISTACAVLLAFLLGYAPLDAGAVITKKKRAKRARAKKRTNAKTRKKRGKKKVWRMKRIKLKGSRHKPEAVYFLYRSKTRFDQRKLRRKGNIKRVIRSVRRTPF